MKLGTSISRALAAVGLTEERVSAFVGAPCGCSERREKLDALSLWAARVLRGKVEGAAEHLDAIVSGDGS